MTTLNEVSELVGRLDGLGPEESGTSKELISVLAKVDPIRNRIRKSGTGRFFVAYTDGSCRSSNGSEEGSGGWAAVLFDARGDKWEAHGNLDSTTSNRAELSGLLAALLCAPEGSHLSVQSDSRYVVDHVRRWMRASDNDDLWTEVRELAVGKQIQLQTTWVAGHNGHQHNERADALATTASLRRRRR
jgi:ribonuclease HI